MGAGLPASAGRGRHHTAASVDVNGHARAGVGEPDQPGSRKTHANYAKSAIHTGDADRADRTRRHRKPAGFDERPEISRDRKVARRLHYSYASPSRGLLFFFFLLLQGTAALLLGLGHPPSTSSDKRRGEWAARCADAVRDLPFRELRRPRRGQFEDFDRGPPFFLRAVLVALTS